MDWEEKKRKIILLLEKKVKTPQENAFILGVVEEALAQRGLTFEDSSVDIKFNTFCKTLENKLGPFFTYTAGKTFPILSVNSERIRKPLGTGCLFEHRNSKYIVTAKHVITRNVWGKVVIPIKGIGNVNDDFFHFSADEHDLAIQKIDKHDLACFDYTKSDCSAHQYEVIGFAAKDFLVKKSGKISYKNVIHIVSGCIDETNEFLYFGYTRSRVYRGSESETQGKRLVGVSGGACVATYIENNEFKKTLAGIFIEHDDCSNIMKCVKTNILIKEIEENFY